MGAPMTVANEARERSLLTPHRTSNAFIKYLTDFFLSLISAMENVLFLWFY